MAQKQQLQIKVFDHREGGDTPTEIYTFTDHTAYLQKMKELANEPGVDVSEQTASHVHLYPQNQHALDL